MTHLKQARLVQLYPPTPEGRTIAQRVHAEWESRQAIATALSAARRSARLSGGLRLGSVVKATRVGAA